MTRVQKYMYHEDTKDTKVHEVNKQGLAHGAAIGTKSR